MYTYFVFTVFYYLFGRTERLPTQGGRERVLSPEQETKNHEHGPRKQRHNITANTKKNIRKQWHVSKYW